MKLIITFSLLFLYSVHGHAKWLKSGEVGKLGKTGIIYARDAFSSINGGTFNVSRIGVRKTDCNPPVQVAAALKNTGMIAFHYLDFGVGAAIINLRYSNGARISSYPFNAKIYLDQENGENIADFNVHNTGGWCNFVNSNVYLKRRITGIHHIFFVFSCEANNGVGTFNLQTLRFTNTNEGVCSL